MHLVWGDISASSPLFATCFVCMLQKIWWWWKTKTTLSLCPTWWTQPRLLACPRAWRCQGSARVAWITSKLCCVFYVKVFVNLMKAGHELMYLGKRVLHTCYPINCHALFSQVFHSWHRYGRWPGEVGRCSRTVDPTFYCVVISTFENWVCLSLAGQTTRTNMQK